jgi:hypothetical protein
MGIRGERMNGQTAVTALIFAIAALTFYFQVARPASLSCVLGDNLALSYDRKGRVVFIVGVSVLNHGARAGVILRCRGSIVFDHPPRAGAFEWLAFANAGTANGLASAFSPRKGVESWVHTVVVPGKGADVKRIVFRTLDPFSFTKGLVRISLNATGNRKVPVAQAYYRVKPADVIGIAEIQKQKLDSKAESQSDEEFEFWFLKREGIAGSRNPQ